MILLRHGRAIEAGADPLVQIAHVRDHVHPAALAHHVRVLGHQRGGDDAGLVLAGLEVRVGKAEEEPCQGGAREEVGQEFHRVGAQRGDVLIVWGGVGIVGSRGGDGLGSEGEDARVCESVDLGADLEAYDVVGV